MPAASLTSFSVPPGTRRLLSVLGPMRGERILNGRMLISLFLVERKKISHLKLLNASLRGQFRSIFSPPEKSTRLSGTACPTASSWRGWYEGIRVIPCDERREAAATGRPYRYCHGTR